jgi:hypothetical protein
MALPEKIEFFTGGCPRSQITEKNLRKAIKEMGLQITIESIDDPREHEKRGVSTFPTVKIEGEVKSEGVFRDVEFFKELLSGIDK